VERAQPFPPRNRLKNAVALMQRRAGVGHHFTVNSRWIRTHARCQGYKIQYFIVAALAGTLIAANGSTGTRFNRSSQPSSRSRERTQKKRQFSG
jgi:hypothetical protein